MQVLWEEPGLFSALHLLGLLDPGPRGPAALSLSELALSLEGYSPQPLQASGLVPRPMAYFVKFISGKK